MSRFFKDRFSRRSFAVSMARLTTTSNWSILKGFSIKSYAPCLMAATAISIFPWPEMITTGTCGWSRWAIFKISIPSILLSFSQMSKINSDGELAASALMHSSDVPASRVSSPSSCRISEISSRISRSSSTIKMSFIVTLIPIFLCHTRLFLPHTRLRQQFEPHTGHCPRVTLMRKNLRCMQR